MQRGHSQGHMKGQLIAPVHDDSKVKIFRQGNAPLRARGYFLDEGKGGSLSSLLAYNKTWSMDGPSTKADQTSNAITLTSMLSPSSTQKASIFNTVGLQVMLTPDLLQLKDFSSHKTKLRSSHNCQRRTKTSYRTPKCSYKQRRLQLAKKSAGTRLP